MKYLYGLHDDIYAQTLAASDAVDLANDSTISQTILAPINKAYADSISTKEVLKQVRYNFIDKPIDVEKLRHGDLLSSKYPLKSLGGATQMIKVTKSESRVLLNNRVEVLPDAGISLIISLT